MNIRLEPAAPEPDLDSDLDLDLDSDLDLPDSESTYLDLARKQPARRAPPGRHRAPSG